jgi:predicted HTH domain antitoxin
MILQLPDEIIARLGLSEAELLIELAVALYADNRISFGKARELASLDWVSFRQILAKRNIPAHYGIEDFEDDLATMQSIEAA